MNDKGIAKKQTYITFQKQQKLPDGGWKWVTVGRIANKMRRSKHEQTTD